jgi:hypothetical protein
MHLATGDVVHPSLSPGLGSILQSERGFLRKVSDIGVVDGGKFFEIQLMSSECFDSGFSLSEWVEEMTNEEEVLFSEAGFILLKHMGDNVVLGGVVKQIF